MMHRLVTDERAHSTNPSARSSTQRNKTKGRFALP